MTSTAAQTKVAAFDLDGTLVRGSSFGQFVRLLICRSPWRLGVAVVGTPAAAVLLVTPLLGRVGGFVSYMAGGTGQNPGASRRTRARLGQACVWLATVGRTEAELRRRARTFAVLHAGADSDNRIEVVLARLAAHQRNGDHVVVVTAAVEPVADEVVRALGILGAVVLGPRLHPVCGGWVPETDRRGSAKVDRLLAAGYRLPIEYAYTDSSDDIALLKAARHCSAVEPRPAHWRALRAAVPDCTILTSAGLR